MKKRKRLCPLCKREYTDYPAISRKDNETQICSDCGVLEAMHDFSMWQEAKQSNIKN
jgi:hypothetical protein